MKSKKDNNDTTFTTGLQSRDGWWSGQSGVGSGSRKHKKDVECFNCHKKRHTMADCWAPGGGSEGKGPQGPRGKKTAAKASPEAETDGVWMVDGKANVTWYALERFPCSLY